MCVRTSERRTRLSHYTLSHIHTQSPTSSHLISFTIFNRTLSVDVLCKFILAFMQMKYTDASAAADASIQEFTSIHLIHLLFLSHMKMQFSILMIILLLAGWLPAWLMATVLLSIRYSMYGIRRHTCNMHAYLRTEHTRASDEYGNLWIICSKEI